MKYIILVWNSVDDYTTNFYWNSDDMVLAMDKLITDKARFTVYKVGDCLIDRS